MSTAAIAPLLYGRIDLSVVPHGTTVDADYIAVHVSVDGEGTRGLDIDLDSLEKAGFTSVVGRAIAFPSSKPPVRVAVGIGAVGALSTASIRDAAAAFARAVPNDARLASHVPATAEVSAEAAAAAIVEGILLARYAYSLRSELRGPVAIASIVLISPESQEDAVASGAATGLATARAAAFGRDLAASPAGLLTATRLGELALEIGAETGLEVDVFEKAAVTELGLGGLLGVNRGSTEEPRMIVLRDVPAGTPTGHLALVGRGIMYDSGGISMKPGDLAHSEMKNDMTGAGDVLAAMSVLAELGMTTAVTGYLMCTDDVPSGSALQLGDGLVTRGGKTVGVLNTDAEGRLVMSDALVLAVEEGVDAIVEIATLTGQALRTLGEDVAALMANSDDLAAQVSAAAEHVDEPVWRLPLVRSYRTELDSDIADIKNLGGPNAGSITAGLFLEEFVAGTPGPTSASRARRSPPRPVAGSTAVRLDSVFGCSFSSPSRSDAQAPADAVHRLLPPDPEPPRTRCRTPTMPFRSYWKPWRSSSPPGRPTPFVAASTGGPGSRCSSTRWTRRRCP
ncbi:leucyl aminopeptidase family protein [Plantibacter sp. Mn2098]|uniref:leucyl aminopeptidase family protein n=1 Tax=Plantibacter sp. Mn2098 TaxID=3395266 RepID=UPI003BCBCEB0